jgi:hypothetical protein
LRLNNVTFDFIGTGEGRKTLLELLTSLNGNRIDPKSNNLDFRFHFDRGDVAWLRAYCHFLCAIVEGYRAVDVDDEFERRMNGIFPKVEASNIHDAGDSRKSLKLADAPRLRRMRLHLVKVCELNRETWTHIRKETDDDFEWLPHPKQTDQLGMPMTDQRIDAWLGMMEQLEGVLNGDRLIPGNILTAVYPDHPVEKGLNLKKLLDDPRPDLFDWNRIKTEGIDAKYLEPEKGKQLFDISAIFAVLRMFGGPLGFAHAARLN